jgi:hypothetical protein
MRECGVGVLIGLLIGVMLIMVSLDNIMNRGYQQGQIDYANDKVLVHKVENEDNELIWEWIDEPKYN